ncbi:MAG: metallophosphoesterase, partial [Chloroflexota bacterium]
MTGIPAGAARAAIVCLLALAAAPGLAGAGQATPVAEPPVPAWTQLGADGLVARTLAAGPCPEIVIDGAAAPMRQRAEPDAAFPMGVCEAAVPAGAASAEIGGQALRLLPATVARIAVVGDTGCRIWQDRIQACNDPAAWPLAEISRQIAAWQPDVILHVGDYVYRESACPEGDARCAGSPYGDTGATWMADFFGPMGSSLGAAPWIFLRGNHENCDREGMGWFRHLDTGPMPESCQPFTEPYRLPLAGADVVVMDTAMVGDTQTTPELDAEYARQLGVVGELSGPGTWLLTHKPIAGGILRLDGGERYVSYATMREATGNTLPAGVEVVVSGHIHLAQALLFDADAGRPAPPPRTPPSGRPRPVPP